MYLDQVGCSGNTKWNAGSDNNDLSILDVMISLRSFYRMLKQIIRIILLCNQKRLNAP